MKNYRKQCNVLLGVIVVLLVSCSKYIEEQTEISKMRLTLDKSSLGPNESIASANLSVSNSDNSYVLTNQTFEMYAEEEQYVSELIQLPEGTYTMDGLSFQNYKNELVLLVPKAFSKASVLTGVSLPGNISLSSETEKDIKIEAFSPHALELHFADFGYDEFRGIDTFKIPEKPDYKEMCVQIGVPDDLNLLEPISFRLYVDGAIALTGQCSKSHESFRIPVPKDSVRVATITHGGVENQEIDPNTIDRFACETDEFINLMSPLTTKPDAEIVFVKQKATDKQGMHEMILIDTYGYVYKAYTDKELEDFHNDGRITIQPQYYQYLKSLLDQKIGKVNRDSLNVYFSKAVEIEMQKPDLHSEWFDNHTAEIYMLSWKEFFTFQATRLNPTKHPDSTDAGVFESILMWLDRVHVRYGPPLSPGG